MKCDLLKNEARIQNKQKLILIFTYFKGLWKVYYEKSHDILLLTFIKISLLFSNL